MTSASFNKLACALGILAALGPVVRAAPPVTEVEEQVEQIELYHGLQRVDGGATKKLEVILPVPKTPLAQEKEVKDAPFVIKPVIWVDEAPAPTLFPAFLPAKMLGMPELKGAAKRGVFEIRANKIKEVNAGASGDASEVQEAGGASLEVPPAHERGNGEVGKANARQAETSVARAEDASNHPVVQAAFIVAIAIVAPLLSLLCFFWLLGRHSRRFGPLFRFDGAGSAAKVTGPFTASLPIAAAAAGAPELDRSGSLEELQDDASEEHLPERFELGPTFEEERDLKKELAQQQEEAVLQHLFEQNILLHEQIEKAAEAAEEEPRH